MIEKIKIQSVASYGDSAQIIDGLSDKNFFYGVNGSGKTTISRVIADVDSYPECTITWRGDSMEVLVYNRDFIESNFNQDAELKGIFTLDEKSKEKSKEIEQVQMEIDNLQSDIQEKEKILLGDDKNDGKQTELKILEEKFENKFWDLKKKYDEDFKEAFKGFRGKKKNYKEKLIDEIKENKATLETREKLKEKYTTIFADTLEKQNSISPLIYSDLVAFEKEDILTKKVIGKEDVDIAVMIRKLDSSDWVKQGKTYYDKNNGFCPFCQQKTEETFAKSLKQYFDEAYLKDIEAIKQLAKNYKIYSCDILQNLEDITKAKPQYLDLEKLSSKKNLVETKIKTNLQHIERKKKEASIPIKLEKLGEVLKEINKLIQDTNSKLIHTI